MSIRANWKGSQDCNNILIVNFAWIFFRMPTLSDAVRVIARIFDTSLPMTIFIGNDGKTGLVLYVLGISMLFIKDFMDEYYPNRLLLFDNQKRFIRWCSYIVVLTIILLAGVFGADQFIYANF